MVPSVTVAAAPRSDEKLIARTIAVAPASSSMAAKEPVAAQSTPSRPMAAPAVLHASSPCFGQASSLPSPQPAPLLASGSMVTTPSPGRRMVVQGSGISRDSPMGPSLQPSPPATVERARDDVLPEQLIASPPERPPLPPSNAS